MVTQVSLVAVAVITFIYIIAMCALAYGAVVKKEERIQFILIAIAITVLMWILFFAPFKLFSWYGKNWA